MGIRVDKARLPTMLVAVTLVACQPPPAECECSCDEAVAEAVAAAQAAAAMVAPPVARPQGTGSARARGPVALRPGTGPVVQRSPEDRTAIQETFADFLKAAEARKLEPISSFLTQRLSGVLHKNAERYEPRFFRGLEETLSVAATGLELGETRDAGQGNVEALFRFGSGHERRVVFFREHGVWKLNRL